MEPIKYQRKYEELRRAYSRIEKLYNSQIINEPGEDSFQSPKDIVLNFFRVCYELKEALKKDPQSPLVLRGESTKVETFCGTDQFAGLSLDITNLEKHIKLHGRKTKKQIGVINTHLFLLSPTDPNHTKLTIEIDSKKEDCRDLAKNVLESWEKFRIDNRF